MAAPLPELVESWFAHWQPACRPAGGRTPLVVGVSGGLDSVVLLHLLHRLTKPLHLELTVLHAHHGLRGVDADSDARWVAALAAELRLPFILRRLPVRTRQQTSTDSLEMAARTLRHRALATAARRLGAPAVALAHHADDQTELLLLRLFRGTGGDGLAGMAPVSRSPADPAIQLWRPLLEIPRVELQAFAAREKIDHCEDASNADVTIPRNRVRHTVLPWLRANLGRPLDEILRRTGQLLGSDSDYIQQTAAQWWEQSSPRHPHFSDLHPALQRAILRRQLWLFDCRPDFELVERLRTSTRLQSGPGNRRWKRLSDVDGTIQEQSSKIPDPGSPAYLPATISQTVQQSGRRTWRGIRLAWRVELRREKDGRSDPRIAPSQETGRHRECFDGDAVGPEIILRHWQPGDRFQPLGFSHPAKLQDLFTNRKVPAQTRRQLLVGTTRTGVLFWVESLPPGEGFKIQSTTRRVLHWTWRRPGSGSAVENRRQFPPP